MNEVNEEVPNTTVTLDEWLEYAKTVESEPSVVSSVDAMQFLSTSPSITGYMTAPVGVHGNRSFEAMTRKSNDLREIKEFFDTTSNQIFPYQIWYLPPKLGFKQIDPITLEVKPILDENGNQSYTETPGMWLVRYAELETV